MIRIKNIAMPRSIDIEAIVSLDISLKTSGIMCKKAPPNKAPVAKPTKKDTK